MKKTSLCTRPILRYNSHPMQLYIQIAEAFLDHPGGVLSIHQLAMKLDLPYGTAYNRIHQLGQMGILNILRQGKAKLCSLNTLNSMAAPLLGLGAAQVVDRLFQSATPLAHLLGKVRGILEHWVYDPLQASLILNFDHLRELPLGAFVNEASPHQIPGEEANSLNPPTDVIVPIDLFF